jgi:hypothetical protein
MRPQRSPTRLVSALGVISGASVGSVGDFRRSGWVRGLDGREAAAGAAQRFFQISKKWKLKRPRTILLLTPCDESAQLTRGMSIFILPYKHVYVLLWRWIAGIEISSGRFS